MFWIGIQISNGKVKDIAKQQRLDRFQCSTDHKSRNADLGILVLTNRDRVVNRDILPTFLSVNTKDPLNLDKEGFSVFCREDFRSR